MEHQYGWRARQNKLTFAIQALFGIHVEPNAGNVIPGAVDLSLDVRHFSDREREYQVKELTRLASAISHKRGLEVEWVEKMNEPTTHMDRILSSGLAAAVEAAGFPGRRMPSGAGHDAMVMATRVPTAMLFIRSPGGISHHPAEAVLEEDVEAALRVGEFFLRQL